jgi:ubiquinone biosynthesis protein COQ9
MLYRTIDTIWFGIGDRSADFSFYTKRGLLAAVYSSTLLYWLEDRSEDSIDSWAFLDRRIASIMQIPKLKSRVKTAAGRLPNPLRLIPKRPRFVRPASSV